MLVNARFSFSRKGALTFRALALALALVCLTVGAALAAPADELAAYIDQKGYYYPIDAASGTLIYPVSAAQVGQRVAEAELTLFAGWGGMTAEFADPQAVIDPTAPVALTLSEGGARFDIACRFTTLPVVAAFAGAELAAKEAATGRVMVADGAYQAHFCEPLVKEYAQIGRRGGVAGNLKTPSYTLKLKEMKGGETGKVNRKLLSLRKDNSWLLDSLHTDETGVRAQLAYGLWNAMNEDNGGLYPRVTLGCAPVELVLNHAARGVYLLREPVDRKQLDVSRTEEGGGGFIVRAAFTTRDDFSAPDSFSEPTDEYNDHEMRYPDSDEGRDACWRAFAGKWSRFLNLPETKDAAVLTECVNLYSFLDYFLYINVLGAENAVSDNAFLSALTMTGGDGRLFVTPWEMNWAFGAVHDAGKANLTRADASASDAILDPLGIGRVLIAGDADGARAYVKTRWAALRGDLLTTDALVEQARAMTAELQSAGAAVADDAARLRTWLDARFAVLDAYVSGL